MQKKTFSILLSKFIFCVCFKSQLMMSGLKNISKEKLVKEFSDYHPATIVYAAGEQKHKLARGILELLNQSQEFQFVAAFVAENDMKFYGDIFRNGVCLSNGQVQVLTLCDLISYFQLHLKYGRFETKNASNRGLILIDTSGWELSEEESNEFELFVAGSDHYRNLTVVVLDEKFERREILWCTQIVIASCQQEKESLEAQHKKFFDIFPTFDLFYEALQQETALVWVEAAPLVISFVGAAPVVRSIETETFKPSVSSEASWCFSCNEMDPRLRRLKECIETSLVSSATQCTVDFTMLE
jgi:hypothetical protein